MLKAQDHAMYDLGFYSRRELKPLRLIQFPGSGRRVLMNKNTSKKNWTMQEKAKVIKTSLVFAPGEPKKNFSNLHSIWIYYEDTSSRITSFIPILPKIFRISMPCHSILNEVTKIYSKTIWPLGIQNITAYENNKLQEYGIQPIFTFLFTINFHRDMTIYVRRVSEILWLLYCREHA